MPSNGGRPIRRAVVLSHLPTSGVTWRSKPRASAPLSRALASERLAVLRSCGGHRESATEPRTPPMGAHSGAAHPQAAERQKAATSRALEPRRLAEKALAAVVQEAYVHGVSTVDRPPKQDAYQPRQVRVSDGRTLFQLCSRAAIGNSDAYKVMIAAYSSEACSGVSRPSRSLALKTFNFVYISK
jgi:hypothetical protein